MTDAPTPRETADHAELLAKLRQVDSFNKHGHPGAICTNWHRNPDGPEAAEALENLLSEIAALRGEVETLTTSGIIEVAVRNPSVADYVQHWEGRATQAERQRDELREEAARGFALIHTMLMTPSIPRQSAGEVANTYRDRLANQGADQ